MLYFVRHGATDWNDHVNERGEKDQIVQGRHDNPLNDRGVRQAIDLANKLSDVKFSKIICSPLQRAVQTCGIITRYGGHKNKVIYDDRIAEVDFGQFEGKPISQFPFQNFWNINTNPAFKNVEHIDSIEARLRKVLDELLKVKGDILMISHGGVGSVLRMILEGVPEDGNLLQYKIPNAEPIVLDLANYNLNQSCLLSRAKKSCILSKTDI